MSSEKYKKVKEEEMEKERPHGAAALDSDLKKPAGFLLMGTQALSQCGNRGRPGEWHRGFVIGGGALNLRGALRVRW